MLYTLLSLPIGCFSIRFQHQILPWICSLSHIHISSLCLSLVRLIAPEILCKLCATHTLPLYRVSQEEMSILWEVIISVILAQKCMCTRVLFWMVSEIELFHCTGVWIWCPILSFTPAVLRPVKFLFMGLDEEWSIQNKSGYMRRIAWCHNVCYRQHKGMSRCTQISNTPCPHMSCKVHWCWRWNFKKCSVLGKLYQLCHLDNEYRYKTQYILSLYQQFCNCSVN